MKTVAYLDSDGNGFGENPWLEIVPPGCDGSSFMRDIYNKYLCKKVVLFELLMSMDPMNVTWDDVDKTKIDMCER